MDHQPAIHQNPLITLDDHHWFHYFDQDHTHLYRDDRFDSSIRQFFNLLDMNRVWSHKQDQDYFFELGFGEDLSLWDCWDNGNHLPLLSYNDDHIIESHDKSKISDSTGGSGDQCSRNRCRRTIPLDLEEIEKHFEMPITMAAEKLGVGLTLLKKRCREFNIKRWPHRKLKSIKSLIQNVKEMGLNEEMEILEEQQRMIKKLPQMDLTQRTKKLRQACFKANYKKRR